MTEKVEDIFQKLESSQGGLTSTEAVKRLKQFGKNELREKKPESFFYILIRQFLSPFVLVLVIAAGILFFLQEYVDSAVIAVVLVVNAVIGVIQEGKAQNTLHALRKFTKTQTLVLRDGQEIRIDSAHVVPGDILVLRAGDKVPADARIIEVQNLRIDEAALTGESKPVSKSPSGNDNSVSIFKGTYINAGTGRAVVTKTGEDTVIGSISKKLETLDSEVPLKKNIRQLSRIIIIGTILASLAILGFGFWAGYPFEDMFFIAVAIAVSVIPEGLPVVITLVLALGVHRMGKKNALVKRMQAVEALGQADVVAVDKTGTITRNELMVSEVLIGNDLYKVEGRGYQKAGNIFSKGKQINPVDHRGLVIAARITSLVSDASLYKKEDSDKWEIIGDPTEAAMIVFGGKVGVNKEALNSEVELLQDIPFDSDLKFHASLYKEDDKRYVYVVGAPEKIIGTSSKSWDGEKAVDINESDREELMERFVEMSADGKRVLAVAFKNTTKTSIDKDDVSNLTIVGLVGMQDSIREGVHDSVALAKEGGVDIVMITGDFKGTAVAIAKSVGIFSDGDKVLTGKEIDNMTEEELAGKLEGVRVFARVTPEQKLAIVNAYKIKGQKIAMTGDGVNDALSLVSADLGISMGLSGTEVAKEASDIVLLDDDINSIVAAIKEGRSIYSAIRKVILYLFSTNLSELFVIVLALSLFLPLPLQPSQILWLNLITDGFLVMAFVFDPSSDGKGLSLKSKGTFIINKLMFTRMVLMATVMTVGTLLMFLFFSEGDEVKGWTVAMTTMAFFQLFNVWNVRWADRSIFNKAIFSNTYLIFSAILVVLLQFFAIYTPFMNTFLKTTPLSLNEMLIIIPVSATVIFFEEIRKLIYRKYV